MNDKARNRIESARQRIQEDNHALADQFRSDSFTERLAAVADLLCSASHVTKWGVPWAWQLVAECYAHLEKLGEPVVVRESARLVDRTPVVFHRNLPLQMLALALGLPDEEHDTAWSVACGCWAWLLREVDAFRRMETPGEAEAA